MTIIRENAKSFLQPPRSPGSQYQLFENFWVELGPEPVQQQEHYILTPSIKKNLNNLARIVVGRKYPVLLQVQQCIDLD